LNKAAYAELLERGIDPGSLKKFWSLPKNGSGYEAARTWLNVLSLHEVELKVVTNPEKTVAWMELSYSWPHRDNGKQFDTSRGWA
jgi:hypothetical protein